MKSVLITGSDGFIGKNLRVRLEQMEDIEVLTFTRDNTRQELPGFIKKADFIFHIAGVNRPKDEGQFTTDNLDLTKEIVDELKKLGKKTPLLITSSSQAELDNPYGKSKAAAEDIVRDWSNESGVPVYIYRLPGVFGKWSRPNYNSVVATFCYNIANGLPVTVDDPSKELTLVYIDDVIDDFIESYNGSTLASEDGFCTIQRVFHPTLGQLKRQIELYHESRDTLTMPSLETDFDRFLYATYTSYLNKDDFGYKLKSNVDDRGWLTEFIKSREFGQIFISETKPGISRGNHWHHTKIEKFFVVKGDAEITFRNKIEAQDVITYHISGDVPEVVDIPAGYVHAIKNVGKTDVITIFWASEILDKDHPDTYYEAVEK